MSHSEQHPLIDLTAILPEDASARLKERRAFFRQAGLPLSRPAPPPMPSPRT